VTRTARRRPRALTANSSSLRAELEIVVDHGLNVIDAHHIAEEAEHNLLHQIPRITAALVRADPYPHGTDHHTLVGHHKT